MSTHAAIIARTPKGEYRGIYLHFDGYPAHTGAVLKEHYATDEKAAALIDLGGLSGIDTTPETCEAYHRDRQEEKRIVASKDLGWVAAQIGWHYLYLWEDGEWHAFTNDAEFREELDERERWEIEQAERAAGWDPNP